MPAPTKIPIESQGRGTFKVKNLKQLKSASADDPPTAHTTTLQSDVKGGHIQTPAQPGDIGAYDGRWPPQGTILPTGLDLHK